MPARFPLFDAHLHADGLSDADLRSMAEFGLRAALVPARDDVCRDRRGYLAHFERVALAQSQRLARLGIRGFAALGVAPSRIPWHGLETILDAIPRLAARRQVVAIGQIGLEEGGEREEQVFERQLELASELNLPVLVCTPEKDKPRLTRRVLTLLKKSGLPPGSVLVDHADRRTLRAIRECGHFAGLTLNPARLSAEEAVRLVGEHGSERLVLSTNAGDGPRDVFALARACALLERAGLKGAVVRRVLCANALGFLRLEREALTG